MPRGGEGSTPSGCAIAALAVGGREGAKSAEFLRAAETEPALTFRGGAEFVVAGASRTTAAEAPQAQHGTLADEVTTAEGMGNVAQFGPFGPRAVGAHRLSECACMIERPRRRRAAHPPGDDLGASSQPRIGDLAAGESARKPRRLRGDRPSRSDSPEREQKGAQPRSHIHQRLGARTRVGERKRR
jgi:hypothetical protein